MLANPKLGQIVLIWYADKSMPYHGKYGRIVIVSKGKPRNHGVDVDGEIVIVPCGNLRKEQTAGELLKEIKPMDDPRVHQFVEDLECYQS